MSDTVIRVEGLGKRYALGATQLTYPTLRDQIVGFLASPFRRSERAETIWALRNVSLEVKRGEVVGIIGRNGAGKSTLLKILSRITEPTEGQMALRGRVGSLLEVGTGFHPELTGRENVFLNGAVLGMRRREIQRKFDEIVSFAELEKFIDTPVKHYSSGMYMRLAFAVAAHVEPEILIVDEVLAVGDAEFQRKCLGKMEQVGQQGRTVLFVSHNVTAIKKLCKRCVLLQEGRVAYQGDTLIATSLYEGRTEDRNSIRRWTEEDGPSMPSARLLEVEALSNGASVGADLPTEKPIQVSIGFKVTSENAKVGTSMVIRNSDDQVLFASISNHEPDWHLKPRPAGMYRSTCEIPANLLAGGSYSISIGLWEGFYEAGILERDVLRVVLHEEGFVSGDLPFDGLNGLMRPLLKWVSARCDGQSAS